MADVLAETVRYLTERVVDLTAENATLKDEIATCVGTDEHLR